jgi:Ribosomal protein S28e
MDAQKQPIKLVKVTRPSLRSNPSKTKHILTILGVLGRTGSRGGVTQVRVEFMDDTTRVSDSYE